MRPFWKDFWIAVLMGFVLPGVLLGLAVKLDGEERLVAEVTQPAQTQPTAAAEPLTMHLTWPEGDVVEMDMDTYLVGVVLAEMPASFEPEALKAQAVVARTYTLKAAETGGKHGNGSVCTDHTCCQAYITPEAYSGGAENLEKIRSAVEATSGLVLTYQGQLIEATYFSCSGGSTEDAVAVWGTDYPYLRATESPGEENAAYYTDTVTFTGAEFAERLGQTLTGSPQSWLGFTTYTAGGGVNSMRIGDRDYKGTELRSLLGLRSTAFTIAAEGDTLTVTTKGYGHRVGMSQYGADAMAVSGSTFEEILTHYYKGTALVRFQD